MGPATDTIMTNETFDLVVIGAGPSGEKGAITAGVFGKKVAIRDDDEEIGLSLPEFFCKFGGIGFYRLQQI